MPLRTSIDFGGLQVFAARLAAVPIFRKAAGHEYCYLKKVFTIRLRYAIRLTKNHFNQSQG